ncbi:efflux RND transporter periplasmic adaptor subunit [Telmatospirillum sp.]|uniref:efflux RND transporter periplasmic adaptor subunit n=1 Tax=Telmatospirillum sp. TaxID=2079197 RepID=UPI00284FE760|nr:efflux RND transporter periplasmic adaptor subunit [Telmatospirillum sp.]MDR3440916.1 efflux RND transporter periplasmic adaptor subunit [Telmatospirillum sp.]
MRVHAFSRLKWAVSLVAGVSFGMAADACLTNAYAQQQAAPPAVTVSFPVKRQTVEWMEFTGQFSSVEYVEIRARVGGYLTEIHFTDGQIVNKGDLLFVIDPRPYEIALASARANVAQATASLELAKRQLVRGGELRQKDFLAASDYDTRVQQTKVAEAALDVARAQVRDAELNLDFTRVTAPVSGRISAHQVSIGNLISGGAGVSSPTLLTSIASLDPIHFNFDMSEADYLTLQRAAATGKNTSVRDGKLIVQLRLSDDKDWTLSGRLDFIDNQIDRSAGTIRARAVLVNRDFSLIPGQFASIRLPRTAPYDALLVPEAAVLTDQSRKMVLTVTDDGTVTPKTIVVGPVQDGLQVVRSGLAVTDKVIVNGLMRARPGAKVTPQAADAGASHPAN